MPRLFDLDRLPVELIDHILHKTTPKSFVRLCRSTKFLHELGHYCKNVIPYPVEQIEYLALTKDQEKDLSMVSKRYTARKEDLQPFRFSYNLLIIYVNPLASSLDYFCSIVKAGKMTFKDVEIQGFPQWEEKEFRKYLDILKPEHIAISGRILRQNMPASLFSKVKSLRFAHTDYGDKELLNLMQKKLDLFCPEVQSSGINALLKQWYRGERDISKIYLSSTSELSPAEVVKDLPVNELYTVDSHHDSLLYMLDPDFSSISDRSYYILFKPQNVFQQFVLVVFKNGIELKTWRDPVAYLMNQLSWNDYQLVAESYPNWRFLPYKD